MVLDLQLDIIPLPPITSTDGLFTYGQNGFRYEGIRRESPDRLRRLLFPEEIKNKREQLRAVHEAKELNVNGRAWAPVQCLFHGVDLKRVKRFRDIQRFSKDAVKAGQISDATAAMRKIEIDLSERYAVENEQHITRETLRLKAAFEKRDNPRAQANFNRILFFQKYFVDDEGNPDQTKTHSPMVLEGLHDIWEFTKYAKRIPGLVLLSEEPQYNVHALHALGWNHADTREALNNLQRSIMQNKQLAKDQLRATEMMKHTDYVTNNAKSSDRPFELRSAAGTYLIRSSYIEDKWEDACDMSMNISEKEGYLCVDFDFNVLKGVMLMARNKQVLRRVVQDYAKIDDTDESEEESEDSGESEDQSEDSYESEEESEDSDEAKEQTEDSDENEEQSEDSGESEDQSEVSFQSKEQEALVTDRKRKAAIPSQGDGMNKKAKTGYPDKPPFRIYFQWGGRETGEGEIQPDHDDGNVGHIDFPDTACTRFEGQAELRSIGSAVRFSGYKISDDSGRQGPLNWRGYTCGTWVYEKFMQQSDVKFQRRDFGID